jgi:hypothetical protein
MEPKARKPMNAAHTKQMSAAITVNAVQRPTGAGGGEVGVVSEILGVDEVMHFVSAVSAKMHAG